MTGGTALRVAIETSTRVGSVAVGRGPRVLAEVELGAQTRHASRALPALDEALRGAGIDRSEIGAVVVGSGPGSFTGVRVAGATAKGLAASLEVPMLAYSSLLSLVVGATVGPGRPEAGPGADPGRTGGVGTAAGASASPDAAVCGLFDARRGEVYAGAWRLGGEGLVQVLEPRVGPVEEVVAAIAASLEAPDRSAGSGSGGEGGALSVVFVGEGVEPYADALDAACVEAGIDGVRTAPGLRPTAAALLWLADRFPAAGRVSDPGAWEPLYVRGSSAERGVRG